MVQIACYAGSHLFTLAQLALLLTRFSNPRFSSFFGCRYTISTNTWSSLPNVNPVTPRTDSCSAEVAGKVVMAGGYDKDFTYLSSLEEFNPATGSWRVLPAQLAIPRGDCAAISLGGRMYIMGGVEPYTPPAGTPDFDGCEEDWNQCFLFSAANEASFNMTICQKVDAPTEVEGLCICIVNSCPVLIVDQLYTLCRCTTLCQAK